MNMDVLEVSYGHRILGCPMKDKGKWMEQQEPESAKPHGERLGVPLPEQSPFHCH